MEITRKSAFTGIIRTIDLPITESQMEAFLNGEFVQIAFPQLTPEQREFILTGVTNEEWNDVYNNQ